MLDAIELLSVAWTITGKLDTQLISAACEHAADAMRATHERQCTALIIIEIALALAPLNLAH
jgi:hypothetical protein